MIQTIALPGTEAVLRVQARAKENFVVCDLPGFAEFADRVPGERRSGNDQRRDWYGVLSFDRSLPARRCGDLSGGAATDKLLPDMDSLVPVSNSSRTVHS